MPRVDNPLNMYQAWLSSISPEGMTHVLSKTACLSKAQRSKIDRGISRLAICSTL